MNQMRIALLGPNGQLGQDICTAAALAEQSVTIVPLDRTRIDLSQPDEMLARLRDIPFDVLVNTTGYHKTDEVETQAQQAFLVNAHSPRKLAEFCGERRARFVHFSTDYVFGGQEKREKLAESDGKAPLNVYGASKGMGEDLVLNSGADVLVLRVASLFGTAGSSGKGGNFVETMIRLAREKGALNVVDDQIMSPTSTADVAKALLGLLAVDAPTGVYHVVNEGAVSWCTFAARIIRQMKINASVSPVPTTAMPTTAKRPPFSALHTGKIEKLLPPMRSWAAALDEYLAAKHGV